MEQKRKGKINIVLYTLLMLIVFVFITNIIIWGYGGNLMFEAITSYPQGNLVISEAVLSIMVLIVMLLFKNSYVFTQKKEPFKTGLFYGLFYLIGAVIFLLFYGVLGEGFKAGLTILNLALGCLLIGICEEFLCRGWLLNEFLERYGETKKGVWYSIIISGVIFGLMHIGNIFTMGQAVSTTITQVISAAGTGIIFGLIYYKTKNIWSVVFLHGLWDFSLFLGTASPIEESVEMISGFSIIGIMFTILMVLAELLNIIPYINDIDAKPKKSSVIIYSIIGIVLFIVFTMVNAISSTRFGEVYEYDNISLENYAVTRDNYVDYSINYNNYNFKLNVNDNDNLLLSNTNTNYSIEIPCEYLHDYIIMEEKNYYIIAYVDYINEFNSFLKYTYINKTSLSNDNQFLDTVKDSFKKYLLPSNLELLVISDYKSNKSYLSAHDIDYGYYLLINENKMAKLNEN